jgi:hypothetical protein
MEMTGVRVYQWRTVQRWNCVFREENCFHHINPYVTIGKREVPVVFDMFPSAGQMFFNWAHANIKTFCLEGAKHYFETKLFPSLLTQLNDEKKEGEPDMTIKQFYQLIGLHGVGISMPTVCRYLKMMNFSYKARGKTFYVDGHERKEVIQDRIRFCRKYMALERRCYRWVQVDEENPELLKLMEGEKPILRKKESYRYYCEIKKCICREFHVDSCKDLQQFIVDGIDANGEPTIENQRRGGTYQYACCLANGQSL